MTIEIFREPMYRRYYTSYTSASFCYALLCCFILLFLPLILAYNSEGFWYKEGTYFEQPSVSYRYQTIVELHGRDTATAAPFSLYYSTSSNLKNMHSNSVRSPIIQSAQFDDNHDGINDRIDISVAMPLKPTEQVSGMSAMFIYDVKLQDRAKVAFDAAALVNYDSGSGLNSVEVDGDVKLRQTWPLPVRGGMKFLYEGSALLPTIVPASASEMEYSTSGISEHMAGRNLSTTFVQTYAVAEYAGLGVSMNKDSVSYFNATVHLRIPEQQIWYTPGVSEVLKWAWVQYVSLFVVTAFLVQRLSSFVFRHQVLHTYSTVDVITEKMS